MGCGGSSITVDDIRSDIMIREEDRAALIEMLASKLKKSTFTVNMLYNGRIHGFEACEFHERCDEKGPTVTICESENGYIFGVYVQHISAITDTVVNRRIYIDSMVKRQSISHRYESIFIHN